MDIFKLLCGSTFRSVNDSSPETGALVCVMLIDCGRKSNVEYNMGLHSMLFCVGYLPYSSYF